MKPRIEITEEKKLIGMHKEMSLNKNLTFQLFRQFMPRKKEILNGKDENVLDLKIYPKGYFKNFNPSTSFTKWALREVPDFDMIPNGMEKFILEKGKYAVFFYKGLGSNLPFEYIFRTWLPNSKYELDDRPHFEILGEKTKLNDPESEEVIWIPIR